MTDFNDKLKTMKNVFPVNPGLEDLWEMIKYCTCDLQAKNGYMD